MNYSAPNQNTGVTFIELMIVVVIVGVLAGLATPQYGAFIERTSILSESRRITSLLKLARSEARSRGTPVVVTGPADANWAGEIKLKEVAGGDEVKISEGRGTVVVDTSFDTNSITFNPRGWLSNEPLTIGICATATDNTHGRKISVNRVGKITEGPLQNDESCSQ